MTDWQQFLIGLAYFAVAFGVIALVAAFRRIKALEQAGAREEAAEAAMVDPYTVDEIIAFLSQQAEWRDGWAAQDRALAHAGIETDRNTEMARLRAKEAAMCRAAIQRIRLTLAPEEASL